ncbi:ATP-grasp domain-containing protein [Plantactinospora sp. WMMB334]|uniref:ATP-grasp domain-containing protein n=1 Tax=Plantactinospora sp. WMMB334 TaxID=3404119 RepID=UPI003B9521E4
MKTLLIVASSANQDLLRTPRELGLRVVVAAKRAPADPACYDTHLAVDEMDEHAVAAAVGEYVAAGHRIDAVACFHEGALRGAARVAADLGLPGNSPEAVMAMRDKAATMTALRAAGVPCPRSELVGSVEEAVAAAERIGYPVVVKPQSSASSQGVVKAADAESVATAYPMIVGLPERAEFRQGEYAVPNVSAIYMDPERRGVLVQEFLDGPEYAVDVVYTGGQVFVLGIHDKPSEWEGDYFIERIYVTPPDLDPEAYDELVRIASAALVAVGAGTGAAHIEVRRTTDGPKIIEINGRLGGTTAFVQESLRAASGVWGPREYLRAVLGERPEVAPPSRTAGFTALLAERTGRITGFEGEEETRRIPGVQAIRWMSRPGDDVVLEYPANPVSCFALVLATGDSRKDVLAALASAERTLRPVISTAG